MSPGQRVQGTSGPWLTPSERGHPTMQLLSFCLVLNKQQGEKTGSPWRPKRVEERMEPSPSHPDFCPASPMASIVAADFCGKWTGNDYSKANLLGKQDKAELVNFVGSSQSHPCLSLSGADLEVGRSRWQSRSSLEAFT